MSRLSERVDRLATRLPPWLTEKVPRDHWESDDAFRRRRRVVAGTTVAGASLLGLSLSTEPDSTWRKNPASLSSRSIAFFVIAPSFGVGEVNSGFGEQVTAGCRLPSGTAVAFAHCRGRLPSAKIPSSGCR